ncbi:MAG: TonB-dependent receptor plug domain-containing protein, partial [Sphingomonadales bacterium]
MSLLALAASLALPAVPASAQAQKEAAPDTAPADETIVVTGSRIARSGFTTPTPVTVLGEERLSALAITNVADGLNQLPSFRATASPANQQTLGGNIGARTLDLRGLGAPRTLVLVDGRRFVPSTSEGTVDINLIPSALIQRAEVVTGGASAVYGSDAVAGVVNFILNRKFEGLKFEAQAGVSQRGDDQNQFVSVVAGRRLGDNAHIVAAFEYENNEGLPGCYEARSWCAQERQIVGNTPPGRFGLPSSIITNDSHTSTLYPGGVINRSLDAAGRPIYANILNDPLRGIKFLPDGTPAPFDYGELAGSLFMIGGDGHGTNAFLTSLLLKVPVERYSGYVSGTVDLSDNISAFADVSYGRVMGTTFSSTFRDFNGSLTGLIHRDNAFLPAPVAAIMDANGIAQFVLGRAAPDFGRPRGDSKTSTFRAVTGLEGSLGGNWKWNAYYQYGETRFRQDISNVPILANVRRATDAVRTPGGEAVCRVNADASTTNDDPACAPLDLFGENRFSAAALDYVLGEGFQKTRTTQHVAAAGISGDLFSLWAGPISAAAGVEWRRNQIRGETDPISAVNGFWVLNGQAVRGSQSVKEAYAEATIPLARDVPLARLLELN